MKALDVAMQSGSIAAARPATVRAVRWDGLESPWVHAAWAAAPWPAWCAIAAFVQAFFPFSSGVLMLSTVLALMVAWAHRPDARAALRWVASVIGTGLLGELFAIALERREVSLFSQMEDLPRAMAIWLVCVAMYEVAPIVAAGSRITAREHRDRALDIGAHLSFAAMAIAAYAWGPRTSGELGATWFVSPWIAAVITLPLAAARCGARRPAELVVPWRRASVVWSLAFAAWATAIVILYAVTQDGDIALRWSWSSAVRHGISAELGTLLALPAWSVGLSVIAAVVLLARAVRARRAPSGVVVQVAEDGITIERAGEEEPMSVALESGPVPSVGETVTLLGLRERSVDVGPFRDGAPRLAAKRAYAGTPRLLALSLAHRAARWLAWAAAGVLGALLIVLGLVT